MNKTNLIKQLRKAYDVKPENKISFLRKIDNQTISMFSFIFNQVKYIRSSLFIRIFGFMMSILLMMIDSESKQYLWLSTGVPFFASLLIYILDSSRRNNMQELEMATRFSLKMVIFARMLISGILSFILMSILSIITFKSKHISLLQSLSTFFLPYWFTVCLCLRVLRKYRDDGMRYCLVMTASISVLVLVISLVNINLNILLSNTLQIMLLIVALLLLINEVRNYFNNMEELQWSLL